MQEHDLPTWPEMYKQAVLELDAARSALADAAGWLRSDWRPLGTPLPDGVGTVRQDVAGGIGRLKGEIDELKDELWAVLEAQRQTGATSSDTRLGS